MNKLFATAVFFAVVSLSTFGQTLNTNPPAKAVSAAAAQLFIGQTNTVIGRVVEVNVREKVAYLNIGKPYPNMLCTGVIFAGLTNRFGNLDGFKDKVILITGKIDQYNGKPQIVLTNRHQLEVVNDLSTISPELYEELRKESGSPTSSMAKSPADESIEIEALQQQIANMQVTNQAKDLYIEQLQKDRDHYVQEMMEMNRKLDEEFKTTTAVIQTNSVSQPAK